MITFTSFYNYYYYYYYYYYYIIIIIIMIIIFTVTENNNGNPQNLHGKDSLIHRLLLHRDFHGLLSPPTVLGIRKILLLKLCFLF